MNPWLVRSILTPLHERICGRRTFDEWRRCRESQWSGLAALHALRSHKLAKLFQHASKRIGYYSRLFEERRIDDFADPWSVLQRLPTLDKQTIRTHVSEFTDASTPGGLHPMATGGSTGEPLQFFVDRRRQSCDKAARMLTHEWFGARPGDREIYLWGASVETRLQDRLRTWRDCVTNEKLLNAFEMSPETMRRYFGVIEAFDPVSIFGYPSSLDTLCRFAQSIGHVWRVPSLKAVFASGEVLQDCQRQAIESTWGRPVANGYGSREAGFIAHECPERRMHICDAHVIVEIMDPDTPDGTGRPVLRPVGELGEIVVTHLDAFGMPLIRYRTGDLGRLSNEACPCGRALTVMDAIEGRRTDQLVRSDGSASHALSIIYLLRDMPGIGRFQIVQGADRNLTIRLVPHGSLRTKDGQAIIEGVRRRLGIDVDVKLDLVRELSPSPSGKHRYVISEAQPTWQDKEEAVPA